LLYDPVCRVAGWGKMASAESKKENPYMKRLTFLGLVESSCNDKVTLSVVFGKVSTLWMKSELPRIVLRAFRVARRALVYTGLFVHERTFGCTFFKYLRRPIPKENAMFMKLAGLHTYYVMINQQSSSRNIQKRTYRNERSNCIKTVDPGSSALRRLGYHLRFANLVRRPVLTVTIT
jgi:hypothetical protein